MTCQRRCARWEVFIGGNQARPESCQKKKRKDCFRRSVFSGGRVAVRQLSSPVRGGGGAETPEGLARGDVIPEGPRRHSV